MPRRAKTKPRKPAPLGRLRRVDAEVLGVLEGLMPVGAFMILLPHLGRAKIMAALGRLRAGGYCCTHGQAWVYCRKPKGTRALARLAAKGRTNGANPDPSAAISDPLAMLGSGLTPNVP